MGRVSPILRFLDEREIALVLAKVYQGACDSYIGGRALGNKLLKAGYYYPSLMRDNMDFVNIYD